MCSSIDRHHSAVSVGAVDESGNGDYGDEADYKDGLLIAPVQIG